MREFFYEVEFLSDVVLPATSNTEGNIQQLDFIAGSNFLGMVAKNYKDFEKSFDVFHSGKVRFGDATLLYDNKITYKMPLSYFFDKGKEDTLYTHHLIKDFTKFTQLKQKRNGYITKDKELIHIDYRYSQKSAYDKTERKSKDGSMFGYFSMSKGLRWQFSIKVDESISAHDLALLKKSIIGQRRLGKSKSAQYGLVSIKEKGEKECVEVENSNNLVLYANSRLALVDEQGNPSYDLQYICKDANVDYAHCQIKTSSFTPYNGAMQTKTYERVCIAKGSVIVLNDISDKQKEEIQKGVGLYLAEGFGEILINPSFLSEKEFTLTLVDENKKEEIKEIKSNLSQFLKQRDNNKRCNLIILKKVDRFILKNKALYKNIKSSQWGQIRSICTSGEEGFKKEINTYISNGTKEWEEKQISTLLDKTNTLEFIKLLSIQMPKQNNKIEEQKDEN